MLRRFSHLAAFALLHAGASVARAADDRPREFTRLDHLDARKLKFSVHAFRL